MTRTRAIGFEVIRPPKPDGPIQTRGQDKAAIRAESCAGYCIIVNQIGEINLPVTTSQKPELYDRPRLVISFFCQTGLNAA